MYMNKFYLIKNTNINLTYVSNILKLCNSDNGILISILNCIFQEVCLENKTKYVVHRKFLLKIIDGKLKAYQVLHKLLKEIGVYGIVQSNTDLDFVENLDLNKMDLQKFLSFNISIQAEILKLLINVIKTCENQEHLRMLNCIYEIEKNNNELYMNLKLLK